MQIWIVGMVMIMVAVIAILVNMFYYYIRTPILPPNLNTQPLDGFNPPNNLTTNHLDPDITHKRPFIDSKVRIAEHAIDIPANKKYRLNEKKQYSGLLSAEDVVLESTAKDVK